MADDERDWRFDPEDVSDGGAIRETETEIEQLRSMDPEPGSPSFENAAFVILGAVLTIAVLLLFFRFI
jgi:hypothetical protein